MTFLHFSSAAAVPPFPRLMPSFEANCTTHSVSPHHEINITSTIYFDGVTSSRREDFTNCMDSTEHCTVGMELTRPNIGDAFRIVRSGAGDEVCYNESSGITAPFGISMDENWTFMEIENRQGANCTRWQIEEKSMLQTLTREIWLRPIMFTDKNAQVDPQWWIPVEDRTVWTDGAGSWPSLTVWTDIKWLGSVPHISHLFDVPLSCIAVVERKTCHPGLPGTNECQRPEGQTESYCCGNGQCALDAVAGCRCEEGCGGATVCCSSGADRGFCRSFCEPFSTN